MKGRDALNYGYIRPGAAAAGQRAEDVAYNNAYPITQ